MHDISDRKDIEELVDKFYKQVLNDDLISVFFTEVVQLDWDKHIPIMYDFWATTLLGAGTYRGNPMLKHIELSRKKPLKPEHFDRWLEIWDKTIKDNFEGEKSTEAINRARQIAELMKFKIEHHGC